MLVMQQKSWQEDKKGGRGSNSCCVDLASSLTVGTHFPPTQFLIPPNKEIQRYADRRNDSHKSEPEILVLFLLELTARNIHKGYYQEDHKKERKDKVQTASGIIMLYLQWHLIIHRMKIPDAEGSVKKQLQNLPLIVCVKKS